MRSKAFSFKCKDNIESKNKIKGLSKSQSKHIIVEEHKKGLDGEEYQSKCENFILKSINNEMYLQKFKKSTFSFSDDKGCYINETESIPWN